jgi:hypothetical protein
MKIFNFLKRRVGVQNFKLQLGVTEISGFSCHYCFKKFDIKENKIFPIQVKLLYKEEYITGKGYVCPHCKKECVIG